MLCIEGSLNVGVSSAALSVPVSSASMRAGKRFDAAMTCEMSRATLGMEGGFNAELHGDMSEASFSYLCPIEFITSCFSLGGWDDDLGWDNNKGWKD